jgi:hypothetical protein
MNKAFVFVLIAGFLMLGTLSVAAELSEDVSYQTVHFSDGGNLRPSISGGLTPCGGGPGGGEGDAPG